MKRPTDATILALYEAHERERASRGERDNCQSITATAAALGVEYNDVQRVVISSLMRGISG
jgi:hypothetical protein